MALTFETKEDFIRFYSQTPGDWAKVIAAYPYVKMWLNEAVTDHLARHGAEHYFPHQCQNYDHEIKMSLLGMCRTVDPVTMFTFYETSPTIFFYAIHTMHEWMVKVGHSDQVDYTYNYYVLFISIFYNAGVPKLQAHRMIEQFPLTPKQKATVREFLRSGNMFVGDKRPFRLGTNTLH